MAESTAQVTDDCQRRDPRELPTLVIVLPARNEGGRLPALLRALPTSLPEIESVKTVVVDDGSSDDTGGVARAEGAIVVRHRVNLGKGGALLTGCEAAERLGADIIVTMDADGQHRPEDVPRLLAPILAGATDMVVGVRALAGEMPGIQRAGNHALNLCIKGLFGVSISDTQCGFRAFRTACYPKLRWRSRGYAVESEMLVRMVRAGLPWEEISIGTIYHDRYKGTQPADGLRILYQMVLWRLGV